MPPDPWIKVRENLHTDPRVLAIATHLTLTPAASAYVLNASARDLLGVTPPVTRDVMRDVTVAGLLRVWIAANRHTVDGTFHPADLATLDSYSLIPGFGDAMARVGYAIHDPEARTVTLPNFDQYNAPAKAGKGNSHSARQKKYRERLKEKASQKEQKGDGDSDVTRDVTLLSISSSNSDSVTVLETLKGRVNSLSPSWSKAATWSQEEESQLIQVVGNLQALPDDDWFLLGWFVKECASPENGMRGEEMKLTTKRGRFVSDIASILERAGKHWRQKGSPRLRPKTGTPSPKPTAPVIDQTHEEARQSLLNLRTSLIPPPPAKP